MQMRMRFDVHESRCSHLAKLFPGAHRYVIGIGLAHALLVRRAETRSRPAIARPTRDNEDSRLCPVLQQQREAVSPHAGARVIYRQQNFLAGTLKSSR